LLKNIGQRKILRKKIYEDRFIFAKEINENLKFSVDGLYVKISFKEGCHSPEFENYLRKTMGWNSNQVYKAKNIVNKMSPIVFSSYIKEKNKDLLFKTINFNRIYISNDDIDQLFNTFHNNKIFEELESIYFDDEPSLLVTKEIKNENDEKEYITKPISQLSLGQ